MSDSQKYTTKLQGSRILIIGGSSGIGFGVAEACVEHGARVAIASSSQSRVDNAVERIRSSYPSKKSCILGTTVNLGNQETLESEVSTLFSTTTSDKYLGGQLDHVIYTAGDSLKASMMPVADITVAAIQRASTLRFVAPLIVAKFIPQYVKTSSRSSYIITTGSISEHPMPNWSIIASFAGGNHSMVRNLALDLKPVRVNGVSPGAVDTELWDLEGEERKKAMSVFEEKTFTGSVGKVEDVVESYLGLLKDGNADANLARTDGGGLFA